MQSETGFPSSHQLKSYVASKSRLKLAARAVLSADAGLLVTSAKEVTFTPRFVGLSVSKILQKLSINFTKHCISYTLLKY